MEIPCGLDIASVQLRGLLLLALQLLWLCWCEDATSGAESQGEGLTLRRKGWEGVQKSLPRMGFTQVGTNAVRWDPGETQCPFLVLVPVLGGVALPFPTTSLLPGKSGVCRQGEEQFGATHGCSDRGWFKAMG